MAVSTLRRPATAPPLDDPQAGVIDDAHRGQRDADEPSCRFPCSSSVSYSPPTPSATASPSAASHHPVLPRGRRQRRASRNALHGRGVPRPEHDRLRPRRPLGRPATPRPRGAGRPSPDTRSASTPTSHHWHRIDDPNPDARAPTSIRRLPASGRAASPPARHSRHRPHPLDRPQPCTRTLGPPAHHPARRPHPQHARTHTPVARLGIADLRPGDDRAAPSPTEPRHGSTPAHVQSTRLKPTQTRKSAARRAPAPNANPQPRHIGMNLQAKAGATGVKTRVLHLGEIEIRTRDGEPYSRKRTGSFADTRGEMLGPRTCAEADDPVGQIRVRNVEANAVDLQERQHGDQCRALVAIEEWG